MQYPSVAPFSRSILYVYLPLFSLRFLTLSPAVLPPPITSLPPCSPAPFSFTSVPLPPTSCSPAPYLLLFCLLFLCLLLLRPLLPIPCSSDPLLLSPAPISYLLIPCLYPLPPASISSPCLINPVLISLAPIGDRVLFKGLCQEIILFAKSLTPGICNNFP